MKKYMVLYYAPPDAWDAAEYSPEEMKKGMDKWMAWAKKCGPKLLEFGSPLGTGQRMLPGGGAEVSESEVTGYSILEAETIDEAKSLLKDHPHLGWTAECQIELHEFKPIE